MFFFLDMISVFGELLDMFQNTATLLLKLVANAHNKIKTVSREFQETRKEFDYFERKIAAQIF